MLSNEVFLEFKTKEMNLDKEDFTSNPNILKPTKANQKFNIEKDVKTPLPEIKISTIQSQTMPLHDIKTEIKGANNYFKQEDHNFHNTFHSFQTPYIQRKENYAQNNNQNLKKIQSNEKITSPSNDDYQKIITDNCQLVEIIKNLQKKLKTLKIQTKLQLEKIVQEKDEEIYDLKNQINQIQSLLQLKTVEMKDKCNKIQSLTSNVSLYEIQLESDSAIEINKKNLEIEQLKQRNESLRSLNYELTQKNDENESNIKSLNRINEKFNILLLKYKQKITELIQDKNENGLQIKLLKEKEIQSENQIQELIKNIQELKDNIQKIKEKYKKKIYRLKLDNNTIIKDLILDKEPNYPIQNLNYATQIKKFEDLINKQQNDLEEKENLINKLKIIINDNQDKINRMETETYDLNKQLKICEENDQQIIDIIQSYKVQYFEIKILLKKINESNHPIKNQICSLILDLDKMINENQNKDKIINDLKKEIKIYHF